MAATFPRIICRVRALYPFHSQEPASLNFEKDDYIDVLAQLDSGWWDGWCGGSRGWFPSNYVEIVEDLAALTSAGKDQHPPLPQPAMTKSTPTKPKRRDSRPIQQLQQQQQQQLPPRRRRSNSSHRSSVRSLSSNTNIPTMANSASVPVPRQNSLGWTTSYSGSRQNSDSSLQHYPLPQGWSVQLAEDGMTRYYYNHRTGKTQFDHPGQASALSDDGDYESDYGYQTNTSMESYSDDDFGRVAPLLNQHQRLRKNTSNRLSLDSLPANVDTPASTFSDEPVLANISTMSHWVQRVTPQGRTYFCNLVTQETTWDYSEIDQTTGRLKKNQDEDSDTDEAAVNSHSNTSGGAVNPDDPNANPSRSKNTDVPLTWQSLSSDIATAIHHLNTAAQRSERDTFVKDASAIVVAIRMMLYASGTLDKDSSGMHDRTLREPHRAVMATLSKLVLSVKTAAESSFREIHPEMMYRVQRDAGDVLAAVRMFVTVCQERNIKVEQVRPQLLFDTTATTVAKKTAAPGTTTTTMIEGNDDLDPERMSNRRSSLADGKENQQQKAKYPLNQDLLVNLQTHANQVYGSTQALCKTTEFILASYEGGNENNDETSASTDSRSNIVFLFRSLSMQVGHYLSILEDIDLLDDGKVPALAEYLVNKQKLYNSVGFLFGAVQTLSSSRVDVPACVAGINGAVQTVETSIATTLSNVDEMVRQRRNWYKLQGRMDDMPLSPVSARFDDSDEEGGARTDLTRRMMLQQQPSPKAEDGRGGATAAAASSAVAAANGSGGSLGYDYGADEIIFGADNNVKGGTLRALVERLTLHDSLDTNFIATFLLTYRSFCTTEEFLTLLEQRYNIRPTEDLTPWELEEWTERKQKLVRLRVFNVMKSWLEHYYNDEDEFILSRLEFFTNTVIRDTSPFSADQLIRLIRKRKEQDHANAGLKKLVPNATSCPLPIMPKDLNRLGLLDIDPTELSRQLTIMDFKLYSSIRPIECLNKAWSQEDPDIVASSVKQSIDYCNRLTCWVSDSILSNDEPRKRVVVIKYWAQVAIRCRAFNNYNTCMAIISAFDTSAIGRLRKTWELVGSRTTQTLANIRKLMGANKNFQEYRDLIHSINPPCIPFLGIYLQDLTFIEDGNSDSIPKFQGLINFAKRQMAAEVIREINQFQNVPYSYTTVPEIQTFMKSNLENSHDVDRLYERSLEIEPREIPAA